jgi:transposase-like protein
MTNQPRHDISEEMRRAATRMIVVRKFPLVAVARHLNVPNRTLQRWVKERRHLFSSTEAADERP